MRWILVLCVFLGTLVAGCQSVDSGAPPATPPAAFHGGMHLP